MRIYSRIRRGARELMAGGAVVDVHRVGSLCALVSSWFRAGVVCSANDCTSKVHVVAAANLRRLAVSGLYVGRFVGRSGLAWWDGRSDGWLQRRVGERTRIMMRVIMGMKVIRELNRLSIGDRADLIRAEAI